MHWILNVAILIELTCTEVTILENSTLWGTFFLFLLPYMKTLVQYSVCYFMWQDTQSYIDGYSAYRIRKKILKDSICNWGQFEWYSQPEVRGTFFVSRWQLRVLSECKSSQELFIWKVCLVINLLKIRIYSHAPDLSFQICYVLL